MEPQTVAIVIRSHGNIPIVQEPGLQLHQMVGLIPFRELNINKMSVINLSKIGGVCYGESDIDKFLRAVITTSKNHPLMTTDDIMNDIVNVTGYTRNSLLKIMGTSFSPELISLKSHFIQKIYTKYDENSKIAVLSCKNNELREQIKEKLEKLTTVLQSGAPLYRGDILNELKDLNIEHLYLVDLTCNAFQAINNVAVREDTAKWLEHTLNRELLRGGRKTKNRPKNININRKTRRKQKKRKTHRFRQTRA